MKPLFLCMLLACLFWPGNAECQEIRIPAESTAESAAEIAKAETDRLHNELNFTDSQYRRIYKVVLSQTESLMKIGKKERIKGPAPRPQFDSGVPKSDDMVSGDEEFRERLSDGESGEEVTKEVKDTRRLRPSYLDPLGAPEQVAEAQRVIEKKIKSICSEYQYRLYLMDKKIKTDDGQ